MTEIIQIGHFIPYLGTQFGGQVTAMAGMVNGLASKPCTISVFSASRKDEGNRIYFNENVSVLDFHDLILGSLRHSPSLWKTLSNAELSIIHSHGLWTDVHRLAATMARLKGIPHVLGPCGMLEPDALKRSWWKKRLVLFWFQRQALEDASCLLANSMQEYTDIRKSGLTNPVAVLPNPVPGPEAVEPILRADVHKRYPVFNEKKTVLFLGRIHPVKGLSRLINAWAQLSSLHEEWNLVLAGPDEGGFRSELATEIENLECQKSVHFIDSLDARWKWAVLCASDLFVMPSDFENFGMSIAEAMLVSKPVVTMKGTPWKSLVEQGAGWWVERSVKALALALNEAMTLTEDERRAMGKRGQVIASSFSPVEVAEKLISLYRWLTDQREQPDFVMFN